MSQTEKAWARKVALMGSPMVGKSAVAVRFVHNQFDPDYQTTITNSFQGKVTHNSHLYDVDILDTEGQNEHTLLSSHQYVGVTGFLLVYSITSKQSLKLVKIIYDKIVDCVGQEKPPMILVGNKADLTGDRKVTYEEGLGLASELGIPLVECSAKTSENIEKVFQCLMVAMEGPAHKSSGGNCGIL